jgi:hypothetical protein
MMLVIFRQEPLYDFSLSRSAMKSTYRASSACLELDFVRDTLFGPVAQRVECHVQLAAINLQGCPALRLHVSPPLPAKLDRAHSVAFTWDGRSYRGVVRDHGRCGDGGLNLLLELQ